MPDRKDRDTTGRIRILRGVAPGPVDTIGELHDRHRDLLNAGRSLQRADPRSVHVDDIGGHVSARTGTGLCRGRRLRPSATPREDRQDESGGESAPPGPLMRHQRCDANTVVWPALSNARTSYGCGLTLATSIPGDPIGMPGTPMPTTRGRSLRSRWTSAAGTCPSMV